MAGHSKWANIKRRKGAQDAKKGSVFTKIVKEITVSVRNGGADPDANPRLRLAIQNARANNMPKDNIERAITKGSAIGGEDYQEVTYEGYAPYGVAVFLETLTDNLNRTVSNIRATFSKGGGSLGTNGSVDYLFERKGIFLVPKPQDADMDSLVLELIDGGAEEVEENDDNTLTVTCAMEDFGALQTKLDQLKIDISEAGLQRLPTTTVKLADDGAQKVLKLIEKLEDDEDVQKVYHNLELTEQQMEAFL